MKPFRVVLIVLICLVASTVTAQKYIGGDISLLPRYEESGATYFDIKGSSISAPLTFFKQQGMNGMRLRLFVDPSKASTVDKGQGVCQDLAYVIALGKRIKAAGMSLVLDFHYSDSWADPSKQWIPDDWTTLSDNDLYTKIYTYTKDVLMQMSAEDATPDFIQIGNEISNGMMWGKEGTTNPKKCYTNSTNNWNYFTTLLKMAGKACREVCPQAKIIIHTERVAQADILKGFYDNMKTYSVDYDIIGLSYYPIYHGSMSNLNAALTMLENYYPDKNIMIVETGYYHDWQPSNPTYDLSDTYPITPEGQQTFTETLIQTLSNHPKVNGLFWWWMEANEKGLDWNTKRVTDNWYNAGLFDNQTGKAEPALYYMKKFLENIDGIAQTNFTCLEPKEWYSLSGSIVTYPKQKGIYITKGKKLAVK